MSRMFAIVALFWVVLGSVSEAQAADDVFTVPRVLVDATGRSAAEARDEALTQGRLDAAQALMRRLSPDSYWGRLPQFGKRESIDIVAGIQIANEKTSSTRYLADVTYSFKPDRIRAALRNNRIPFSETQARTAVVLPVFETDEGTFLWEAEQNPWAAAWSEKRLTHELVPLLAPLGELADLVSVNTQDAINQNWARLGPFAERYNVSEVLVAYAKLQQGLDGEELRVTLSQVNGNASALSAGSRRTSVTIRNTNNLPLEDLLSFGIDQAVARLQTGWKSQTIIQSDAIENMMFASVRFKDHRDWLTIREGLSTLPAISDLQIQAVSMTGADVVIRHLGALSQLRVGMAQRDLSLITTDRSNLIVLGQDVDNLPLMDQGFIDNDPSDAARDVIETREIMMEPTADPMEGAPQEGGIVVDIPLDNE